jgi:uncharacterized LabA/DUF88 family protein
MEKENNHAFIDGTNLYKSVKEKGWAISYQKFRIYLRDKYNITIAYMFYGYHPNYDSIYESLRNAGFEMIFKPTSNKPNGEIKGNIDAELVLNVSSKINEFDKAIIVAGDGDYRCLIEYLIGKNKLLKILIPNKERYSSLLREFATYFQYLDDIKDKLEYFKKVI